MPISSKKNRGVLVFRADANAEIGVGHLMRSMALAQVWQKKGGEAVFVVRAEKENRGLLDRLQQSGISFISLSASYPDPQDLQKTLQVLSQFSPTCLILDGYHFDFHYQQSIRKAGHTLLVMDDIHHLDRYSADFILNQNSDAFQRRYVCNPEAQLLLGSAYALLRSEFLEWKNWKRSTPQIAKKILVTLGGGDAANVTGRILEALKKIVNVTLEIRVIVGPANPHLNSILEISKGYPHSLKVLNEVRQMPECMAWADLAIAAAGSTCWEMAFMGLPSLLLVLAENQVRIAHDLSTKGVAVNLGEIDSFDVSSLNENLKGLMADVSRRQSMSEKGRELIDGEGAERVCEIIQARMREKWKK